MQFVLGSPEAFLVHRKTSPNQFFDVQTLFRTSWLPEYFFKVCSCSASSKPLHWHTHACTAAHKSNGWNDTNNSWPAALGTASHVPLQLVCQFSDYPSCQLDDNDEFFNLFCYAGWDVDKKIGLLRSLHCLIFSLPRPWKAKGNIKEYCPLWYLTGCLPLEGSVRLGFGKCSSRFPQHIT